MNNTPKPNQVAARRLRRLVAEARKPVHTSESKSARDNAMPVNVAFVLADRGWDGTK